MATIDKMIQWMNLFIEKVTNNKSTLNDLDTAIGDGDHGSNMNRGVNAIKDKLADSTYDSPADLFKDIGMTLISKVGGASGPLYGSAFISMAKVAKESDNLADIFHSGLEGIQKRGKADVGEKTMVDVWAPATQAIQIHELTTSLLQEALEKTKNMKATKGRASYLGDRSLGHLDPGAQSSVYLFEALLEAGVLDE